MDDSELLGYVKQTMLGINAPAQQFHEREFLDQTLTGELHFKRTSRGFTAMEDLFGALARWTAADCRLRG
ncbi:MAG: hypothetical protein HC792_05625, partial [Acaryochloridaceae cyanobacterium CSU_5_19]|nr:hypothetical protein [Acaryochloridaceae cyanobacterium CSU_5_19]